LDGGGGCIALVAQNTSSTAEFLDRNGVAPIKPDRDNDEGLVRRIPARKQSNSFSESTFNRSPQLRDLPLAHPRAIADDIRFQSERIRRLVDNRPVFR
jgi:hypothetical protein